MAFQFLINGIIIGLVYAIFSSGYSIIYNTTRIFHIAYAGLYVLGGYLFYNLNILKVPIILAAVISIALTAVSSFIIEYTFYRPLVRKRSSLNVIMITSIGVFIIVTNMLALIYGNDTKVINRTASLNSLKGSLVITQIQAWQFAMSIIALALYLATIKFTKLGIIMRAIRDDHELITVFGIDSFKYRSFFFLISGAIVGFCGCIISYDSGISPYRGINMLLYGINAMIIGGIGKFSSSIMGGVILGIVQSFSVFWVGSQWSDVICFSLLLILLLVRPHGIMGEKQRAV